MTRLALERVQIAEERGAVGYRRLVMEAERDASELLEKAWVDGGSSRPRLPVDPFAIARKLGIQVYVDHALPAEVSGMLRKPAGYSDPEILLNSRDSRNRQRFTCAHELGHYSQRVKHGLDGAWEFVDRRDPLSSQGSNPDEIYANKFAAELLMPRDEVKSRASDQNPASLALDFGVSADAMRFRLENLGLA